MGKVIILDENTSNKIAAGEVVERPASVVKELVENSIDAEAKSISIEIANGGISYIKVVDNGTGIDEDDLEIAFERHATSKIRSADDLDSIMTMGFRGEALASIASVSTVEVSTRVRNNPLGTYIRLQGGVLQEIGHTGCPAGTTFIVRDLFYNTPARFKFLKKDSTEAGYVSDLVSRIALANPDISFRLVSNHAQVMHTPGNNDLRSTIFSIYGREVAQNVLEVNHEEKGIRITGYAGKPEISRGNRNHQSILVNGRYIRDKLISSAIDEAYKTLLMKNKYAFVVLNIRLNPLMVDVNVHPTKMEVRFSEEQNVFRAVYHAVNNALLSATLVRSVQLENKDTNIFKFSGFEKPLEDLWQQSFDEKRNLKKDKLESEIKKNDYIQVPLKDEQERGSNAGTYEKSAETNTPEIRENPANPYVLKKGSSKGTETDMWVSGATGEENEKCASDPIVTAKDTLDGNAAGTKTEHVAISHNNIQEIRKETCHDSQAPGPERDTNREKAIGGIQTAEGSLERTGQPDGSGLALGDCTIIGQAFSTYVILQQQDELILVDQHAAHERITYEHMKKRYTDNQSLAQELLAPLVVEVTGRELKLLQEESEFFNKLGFIYEEFGNNSIVLRSVPFAFIDESVKNVFMDVLDSVMKAGKDNYSKIADEAIYSMACKAAVKANRRLDGMEIRKMLEDLGQLENPYTCPHGRPTVVRIKKQELEKMFKRIV